MSDYGEVIAPGTVRFQRTLPGPVERIWRYLVDEDKRARWLCGGETELVTGGKVEMHFHNASLSDKADVAPPEKYKDMPEKMQFFGTVTACVPPTLLSHTWDFEGQSSEVVYELREVGDQVELTLTHRRLDTREEMVSVCGGWHTHLDILADLLAEKKPEAFWTRHNINEAEYESRLEGQ